MNLRFAGALSAFVAVAAGAFGAHALKSRLTPELLTVFETGARYHLVHALALFMMGEAEAREPGRGWASAGIAFLIGTMVFAGSLYALSLTGVRLWGAVTPLGGLALLIGWVLAARAAWRASH
ncbi:MAG: DUF423 domain-containing protein [Candidatus Eisenbacteria bacterium]